MIGRRVVLAGAAILAAPAVRAQSFPDRPLRLVVAFPPGGNVDFTARLLAPALSAALGQPVVVDNRPGAAGIVGTESGARARPADGHVLLLGSTGPLALFPVAMPSVPYDTLRDLAPVGIAYQVPIVVMVAPGVRARALPEFVALAKATRGGMSAGTSGIGSGAHLTIELLNASAGTGLIHVPYRGTGPALNDLIGGTIPCVFDQLSNALPLHADGRARIIGVTSAARSPLLPEVGTFREAGLIEPELSTTLGLLATAGTPPAAVDRLRAALVATMADATVRGRLTELGGVIPPAEGITPARYAEVIREETEVNRRAVQLGNIRLE